MRILLIYHFFQPDMVISARLFSELAAGLVRAGHEVTVYTSDRCIRRQGTLPHEETWEGVRIERFSRPDFRQGSNVGRVLNSFILQRKWVRAFRKHQSEFDVVIVGTDPQFAWLMFPKLKRIAPRVRLIHWVFDLYPEALAASRSKVLRFAAWLMRSFAKRSYRSVDVMADIGDCMRQRLREYGHPAREVTITPWALEEPKTVAPIAWEVRRKLFGDAKLCLLYSGTVGHAHDITPFIALARECRKRNLSVAFCFAGYGNQYDQQTQLITADDTNISLAGFASEEELAARLAAADFHLVSLREGWEGIVIPSKFFGALAMGRPVIFAGPPSSSIAQWIHDYQLGYVLDATVLDRLEEAVATSEGQDAMKANAHAAYQKHFSRLRQLEAFQSLLDV